MKDFTRYLLNCILSGSIIFLVFSCTSEVPAPPKADFNHTLVANGSATEVTFTNNSANAASFKWDFGDGSSSAEISPKHTYNSAGDYNVKLVAKGDGGSHGINKTVSVKILNKPVAAFDWQPSRAGAIPSVVVFTNKSTGGKTFFWDFGDGTTSTEEKPTHSYVAGQYVVKLTVTGDGGQHTTSTTIMIISATPTVAAFDISGADCKVPCTVSFTNRSAPQVTDYKWEFNDGGESTQKDPSYEFKKAGTYNVKLTVKGPHGTNSVTNTVSVYEPYQPVMVAVEGGDFMMGSLSGDTDEQPLKKVTLSSYSIGKYPVSVGEYRIFCNETGYAFPTDASVPTETYFPINNVNYVDATSYCEWISKKTGKTYRLPTEAEWEYAARGGNKSNGYIYSGSNTLSEVGNYFDASKPGTSVQFGGWKRGNELGIFEMSGNVKEWCGDWYVSNYYTNFPAVNPKGPASGRDRVTRGGHLYEDAYGCRVAKRDKNIPTYKALFLGFRVALIQ